MAHSHTRLNGIVPILGTQFENMFFFDNLHLHYDSHMYFTSIFKMPLVWPQINMTYNRAASEKATGLSPKILTRIDSYYDQMDH